MLRDIETHIWELQRWQNCSPEKPEMRDHSSKQQQIELPASFVKSWHDVNLTSRFLFESDVSSFQYYACNKSYFHNQRSIRLGLDVLYIRKPLTI